MEELQEIHAAGNTIIMVTHNPALTTYATRVINMLDGEIDTDIKTVDDSELPRGGKNEKVSVKVLPNRDNVEMEIISDSEVTVSGENVSIKEEEPKEEKAPAKKPAAKKSTSKKKKSSTKKGGKK
jgi:energy-coupling factor transporter ATP-binding protein EcfA2